MKAIKIHYDARGPENTGHSQLTVHSLMLFPQDEEARAKFYEGHLGASFGEALAEFHETELEGISPTMAYQMGRAAAAYGSAVEGALREVKLQASKGSRSIYPGEFAATMLLVPLRLLTPKAPVLGTTPSTASLATNLHDEVCSVRGRIYGASRPSFGPHSLVLGRVPEDERGLIKIFYRSPNFCGDGHLTSNRCARNRRF